MSKSSKIIIVLLVVLIIAVLGVGGYIILNQNNKEESSITNVDKQTSNSSTSTNADEEEESSNNNNNANSSNKTSYTKSELESMAIDYYEKLTGYRVGHAEAEDGDGTLVNIHLYDDMGDHTATSDWYEIDMQTGKGHDLSGNEIDLTTVR